MSDFERKLSEALKDRVSDYRPSDPYEAKHAFLHRFRRRRIVTGGLLSVAAGAAVVAAVLVVPGLFPQETTQDRDDAPVAGLPSDVVQIPVGGVPNGIAFGSKRVWVANSADGTISSIRALGAPPAAARLQKNYEIGGSPDDLAVGLGAAWVADADRGIVTKISLRRDRGVQPIPVGGGGGGMDIAVGTGAAWVVADGALYRIDAASGTVDPIPGISDATDVAAGHGAVAVVGKSFVGRVEPGSPSVTMLAPVDETVNQDLHVSPGAAWFGNGDAGTVTRIDLASGDVAEPVEVGGTYVAIAQGSGSLWVVVGDSGDAGRLFRLDPSDGSVVGDPLTLGGRPYDVATGARAVWVLNRTAELVTRIDPHS